MIVNESYTVAYVGRDLPHLSDVRPYRQGILKLEFEIWLELVYMLVEIHVAKLMSMK